MPGVRFTTAGRALSLSISRGVGTGGPGGPWPQGRTGHRGNRALPGGPPLQGDHHLPKTIGPIMLWGAPTLSLPGAQSGASPPLHGPPILEEGGGGPEYHLAPHHSAAGSSFGPPPNSEIMSLKIQVRWNNCNVYVWWSCFILCSCLFCLFIVILEFCQVWSRTAIYCRKSIVSMWYVFV